MFSSDIINLALNIDFENKINNKKTFYSRISKIILNKLNVKVSRHIISKWIKNKNDIFKNRLKKEFFNDFKKITPLLFTNKSYKIKKINLELVSNYITLYPTSSRIDIKNYILKDFNISLSLNTITSIIKKLNFTRKKINYQVIKNKEYINSLNIKRKEFITYFKDKYLNKIIFIDETGFNTSNIVDNKGLSKKGTPIYMPDKTRFMRNLSMIMSINRNFILDFEIYEESIDSLKFYNFINKIINKLKEKNYIFVFDNVSFHHNKDMLKLIKDNNHTFMFTPPYSPNLNPIENVFSVIKKIYKDKYKNINLSDKTFSIKEQISIIEDSILEFIYIYYIDIEKTIIKALNYSYEIIEKECIMRYK